MNAPHRGLALAIAAFDRGRATCQPPEDHAVATRYLAELAPLLASVVLGEDILRRLDVFERLLGHTWLEDSAPFEPALAAWRCFRDEYEQAVLGGMTVNERLVVLGFSEAFDEAKRVRAPERVADLLRRARVDEASIREILRGIGGQP